MYGIPFIDVPLVSARIARSALPHAPVIEDEQEAARERWPTAPDGARIAPRLSASPRGQFGRQDS